MLLRVASAFALTSFALCAPIAANADPENAFVLTNKANVTLHFSYGCKGGNLANRSLGAGMSDEYWSESGCRTYTIKKSTTTGSEEKTFTYTLYAGHSYHMAWDKNKNAWNIFEDSDDLH